LLTKGFQAPKSACAVVVLGLVLSQTGCRGDNDPPTPSQNDDAQAPASVDETAAAQAEAFEKLSSLGYIDYSVEEADASLKGVVRIDRQRSYPGYNLFNHAAQSAALLIDQDGRVIHTWAHQRGEAYCELLPNGDLLVLGKNQDEVKGRDDYYNRRLLRMSWDGRVIWKKEISAHHDVEVTPRDQILTLSLNHVRRPIHPDGHVRENPLTLVSQDGAVIEKLPLYEVLSGRPDLFQLSTKGIKVQADPRRSMDLFHANSVEWMHHEHLESRSPIYASSNLLMSMRNQNAVAIINWDTKQLVWAWGPGDIFGPHDATMLESGNILLFDNGRGRGWSRVIELDPLTRKIVWEYKAPTPTDFFTSTRGSSQRLGNGNTLITNSNSGQVFEVTPRGEVVWEFLSPQLDEKGHRATIVRTKRYERAFVERLLEQYPPADGSLQTDLPPAVSQSNAVLRYSGGPQRTRGSRPSRLTRNARDDGAP
jgi:hypothetical protein